MNPLTNMKNVLKLSERELKSENKTSWHDMYKDSAWIFVGGLPYDLTEGDIICIFSQYGEIVNINLVRDKKTGKQKGFCFICYEDQRSTTLAVDNLNGIKILGRTIRVDHVSDYKVPKENDKTDEETRKLYMEGCAPKLQIPPEKIKKEIKSIGTLNGEILLSPPVNRIKTEAQDVKHEMDKIKKEKKEKEKKDKKSKKEKSRKSRKKRKCSSSTSSLDDSVIDSLNEEKEESRDNKRPKHRNRSRERRESNTGR